LHLEPVGVLAVHVERRSVQEQLLARPLHKACCGGNQCSRRHGLRFFLPQNQNVSSTSPFIPPQDLLFGLVSAMKPREKADMNRYTHYCSASPPWCSE
jgi:hypothetical protein